MLENWPIIDTLLGAIVVPIMTGLIIWLWRLDNRTFSMSTELLTRNEFRDEIKVVHAELVDIRKSLWRPYENSK